MRLIVSALLLSLSLATVCVAEDGYQEIFNGKDLTGWDGNPDLWSVQDGVITGVTKGELRVNQFLVWTGGTVSDFELKLEFRFEGDSNSGVQYRSQRRPDIGDWVVAGYQADIHPNPPYVAMLYDEKGRGILAERGQKVVVTEAGKKEASSLDVPVTPVDLTKWHELKIICQGNRLRHFLDGVPTIEVIDDQPSAREMDGVLALQLHVGPAAKAQFRNVRLKTLAGAKTSESRPASATAAPRWVWLAPPAKKEDADKKKAKSEHVYFRRTFDVPQKLTSAKLLVSGDDKIKAFVEGVEAGSHDGHRSVSNFDVTAILQRNAGKQGLLALDLENIHGSGAALARLEMTDADGKLTAVVTDDSWLARPRAEKNWQQPDFQPKDWGAPKVVAELGQAPYKEITAATLEAALKQKSPESTPVDRMVVARGFNVERLYSVPKLVEGSWVSMCTDPRGRLIVCDQYGGLFRVTPPGINGATELQIEKIPADIGEAQGLLWAFDSLYVVVNRGQKYQSGVYRVTDTDNDDQLDKVEQLRALDGGGEHGPHAALLSPDGQSIYIVCGNNTRLPELSASRVPKLWDEDTLLPRIYGKGFMKGVPPPAGCVSRMSPDGKEWELVTIGFRNPYDAAFNADGELFAYDADMEWDINTPWYRPTRLCQVLSGADYGWRNGSAKFPQYYVDTVPPVVNIGPGSPTGVCFGYGAKFPEKYQRACFIADWSYGKLYAVHMVPKGAGYSATVEEFVTGTPLPLTDVIINPVDHCMYFTIGGRKVQSGLYRVTYTGTESTAAVDGKDQQGAAERAQLRTLQKLHLGDHPEAVEVAWPFLGSDDPVLRSAARTAIEMRPQEEWLSRGLNDTRPWAKLEAILAATRQQERSTKKPKEAVDTVPPSWAGNSETEFASGAAGMMQLSLLTSLGELNSQDLTPEQRLAATRIVQLILLRFGPPDSMVRDGLLSRFETVLPTKSAELNAMLIDLQVYLQAPNAAEQGMALLRTSPSQEEQIHHARALSNLRTGWTPELQKEYFSWFHKAATFRGGVGFALFVKDIRDTAEAGLSDADRERLKPILEQKMEDSTQIQPVAARPFVREWKMEELSAMMQTDLQNRDYEHGRQMFGAAACYSCHRFNGEGGALGPDLTALAGRFDPNAILESILEPSKTISDQYAAVQILTLDGHVITGRIVNLHGDSMMVNTNMLDPNANANVNQRDIEEMMLSKVSMMPQGLLNTLNQDEVLDLMAFLLSRGDRSNPMFKPSRPQATTN